MSVSEDLDLASDFPGQGFGLPVKKYLKEGHSASQAPRAGHHLTSSYKLFVYGFKSKTVNECHKLQLENFIFYLFRTYHIVLTQNNMFFINFI